MVVEVTGPHAVVKDGDDLTRLEVTTQVPLTETDAALRRAGLGRLAADGHAHLSTSALFAAASPHLAGWREMLAYAESNGWLKEGGAVVVAHVERP